MQNGEENPAIINPTVNYMSFVVQSGEVFGILGIFLQNILIKMAI